MDLYIYYRVDSAHATTLFGKIKGVQAMLQARLGIAGALKRRPGEQDGLQTWMEIYAARHDDPNLVAELQAELVEGPPLYAAGTERHVEAFVPCAW